MNFITRFALLLGLTALAACSSTPPPAGVKIGKPYSIMGKTYFPAYEPDYDETGIASWYGPGFHGKSTANGERFDTHDYTAAHPTLPMPSLVRVTRLETGESIVVRINDRGPFSPGRIIDLSRAGSKKLGIDGLAKVRVQYLQEETEAYIAARKEGRNIDMADYNDGLSRGENLLAGYAPPQAEIVEASNGSSQMGSEVSPAAPLTSISSEDLPKPKRGGFLISDAMADAPPVNRYSVGKEVVLKKRGEPVAKNTPTSAPIIEPERLSEPIVAGNSAGYYIQAGSFANEANAKKLGKKISQFAEVSIAQISVNNGHWWRVRAGPFGGEEQAHEVLASVQTSGAPDARIVKQ